jgi:ribokinase
MRKSRVIVIGSYLVALVMDVDRFPLPGETLLARNFRQTHGGKGSNQVVQAARLGALAQFIGIVGNDTFGRSFIDLCKTENIDTTKIQMSNRFPTGAGFIICSSDGQNIITIDIGANLELSTALVDQLAADICPGDVVLIQLEIPLISALYAARVAKRAGAVVILNPAPAANLSNHELSFIDVITPNETEARICSGTNLKHPIPDEQTAKKLHLLGCSNVIITQGAKGCLLLNENGYTNVPAFQISETVDSTGAGDSFNGALAVALLEGKPLADACRFANAAAGLACTKPDTIPSYHFRSQVDKFMADK